MDVNNQRFDPAAAAEVFLDHEDFIRGIIRLHVHDEAQADDLFQDFFLSLVSSPLPADVRNVESYLYKAIVNDIIDAAQRKRKYRNCMRSYAERSNLPRSQQTPAETVLEKDEANRVFDLIERRLPRTEAQAVYLLYREGDSTKVIAERMGVGPATVRGYLSDGLSRTRRLLNAEGVPGSGAC